MKHLLLALSLLAGTAATAQSTRFGLKAGASFATLTTPDAQFTTGLHAGLMIYSPLGGAFAVQPELLYSQKGFHVTARSGPIREGDETLHYFDLPLPVKFRAAGLYLEAGPQLGILMQTSVSAIDFAGRPATGTNDNLFNAFELGYVLGLGYQGESGLVLGLRYNGGISDAVRIGGAAGIRNSVIQLSAGFLFGGGDGHAREFSQ